MSAKGRKPTLSRCAKGGSGPAIASKRGSAGDRWIDNIWSEAEDVW
jgi:hypothetical protein